ncbi:phosphatase 2C-like domain-containing protein [Hysterangium stoloniferum]|nr:phosphatase 2C-like domain-containing protein [Hysterangium stoloniferum]
MPGHYDGMVSEYASKNLMKEVDRRITAVIAEDLTTLYDIIPTCLVHTIQEFDATLHQTMIEKMHALDSKSWNEWTKDDIPHFLEMGGMNEDDPYPIMRRACAGSTALIAVVFLTRYHTGEPDMWVASLGDSEGCESCLLSMGQCVTSSLLDCHPLNNLNLHNPAEVQRLQEEHPDEDDLIIDYRTKGSLGVTRALGDAILKVPIDLPKVFRMMWGCPVHPDKTDRWGQQRHTPPYISSTPSITHFSIQKGDILVFSSDGLRSSLTEKGVPDHEIGKMIVSITGMDLLDAEALISYEKAIGHSFIPSVDIDNVADRVIRNVLFGMDNHRMARETMAKMNSRGQYLRDDISLFVVHLT